MTIYKKILVRATNWIGDAIMLTPAVTMLREHLPDAHITVCARSWVLPVFSENPYIDAILPAESAGGPAGIRGIAETVGMLRRENFDLSVIFPNSFSSALTAWLSGIPERTGYAADMRGIFLTRPLPVPAWKGTRHEVFYYCNIISSFFGTGEIEKPELLLRINPAAEKWTEEFCHEHHIRPGDILIGFNPGAAFGPAKCWPVESFQKLGKMFFSADLPSTRKVWVVVLGTEKERDTGEKICSVLGENAINLCGRTDLSQVMAVIDRLDLLVTNDSGLMHVGAALSTPLVALFGSTNPQTTGPWSSRSRIVQNRVECAPCLKRSCPSDFRCMKGITPEMVFEAGMEQLEHQLNG